MRSTLRSARLRLDTFRVADLDAVHALLADPATNTVGTGPHTSREQTAQWVARRVQLLDAHGLAWYGIRTLDSDALVGSCGVLPGRTGVEEPELAYMIHVSWRGNGYASEAAASVMSECRDAEIPRLWATVRPSNHASRRVLRRSGFRSHHRENDAAGPLLFLLAELHPVTPPERLLEEPPADDLISDVAGVEQQAATRPVDRDS